MIFTVDFQNKHILEKGMMNEPELIKAALPRMQRLRQSADKNSVLCLSQLEVNNFAKSRFIWVGDAYQSEKTFGFAVEMTLFGEIKVFKNYYLKYNINQAKEVSHLVGLVGTIPVPVPKIDIYRAVKTNEMPPPKFYKLSHLPHSSGLSIENAVVRKTGATFTLPDFSVLEEVHLLEGIRTSRDDKDMSGKTFYTDMENYLWNKIPAYFYDNQFILL